MVDGRPGNAEFGIFCRALRQRPEEREVLADDIAQGRCDWAKILEGARRHRVEHQLLAGLSGHQLPPTFVESLRAAAQDASRVSLMQMREVARIAAAFQHAGVPIMALKGVALSVQLGRDPTHRNSRDIDFLIHGDGLLAGDRIMRAAGYKTEGPDVSARAANYLRWNKEVKYFHPDNRTLVELHYRLADNKTLLHHAFDHLWQEREFVRIANVDIAVMARHRLPVYLCAHGAAHAWERLCWLADLAAALPSQAAAKEAVAGAASAGLEAPMLHAILLAHEWLGCSVDQRQIADACQSRDVARFNSILARSYGPSTWFRSPRRGSTAGFARYSIWLRRYVYSLKPSWRYRASQLARELIAPADWDTFGLPRPLSWAYPLLRPAGWIVRRLRGTA